MNNIPLDESETELSDADFWKAEAKSEEYWAEHYFKIAIAVFGVCEKYITQTKASDDSQEYLSFRENIEALRREL
jgi:hypothetical protein